MIYSSSKNSIANWTTIPGRQIVYEYYQGNEPESGGRKSLKKAIFYDENGFVRFAINYEWNSDGQIIKEYCTKN